MKSAGKKSLLLAVSVIWGGVSVHAAVVNYDGGDPNNNLLSSALNWESDAVPATSVGTLALSGSAVAPVGDPAIVDLSFTQDISSMNVYHTVLPANDAFIEVSAGKTLTMSSPVMGRPGNASFGGTLTVRSGGTIMNPFPNGGATSISMDRYGVYGSSQYGAGALVLEHGASFRTAWINLGTNGTLHLEFGTTTVPTVETSGNTGEDNVLDGVVQLDLANLTTAAGTHTLINGTGGALLVGGLKNWLDGEGGFFSGTGSFFHANFEVLNGAGNVWSLSLSDGNQDLVFSLDGDWSEPEELDATVRDTGTVVSFSALPVSIGGVGAFPIGADGGESFLIDLSDVRSIDYVQLRKQFWTGDVPADLELAIYTGAAATIPEIAANTNDWQIVVTLVSDGSNSDKVFAFPTVSAQFLKVTIFRTENYSVWTDVGEIILGSGANVVISDADGDEVSDWDEIVAGTDPYSTNSVPLIEFGVLGGTPEIMFTTSIGRLYAVLSKTNLLEGTWVSVGNWAAGTGDPISVLDRNVTEQGFYRVQIIWP